MSTDDTHVSEQTPSAGFEPVGDASVSAVSDVSDQPVSPTGPVLAATPGLADSVPAPGPAPRKSARPVSPKPAAGRRGVLVAKDDAYLFVPDDLQTETVTLVDQAKRPSRWPAIIALVCVAIASAVITAALMPKTAASPTAAQATTLTPQETVVAHLTAVSEGKATEALTYAARVPDDQLYLTDAVVGSAVKAHPLKAITAKETSRIGATATVEATFMIDETPVTTTYSLTDESGKWQISDAVVPADLTGFAALEAQVYGVRLGPDPVVALLPGRYELTTAHTLIGFGGSTFDAVQPGTKVDLATLTPVLSADGAAKVTAAITAKFDACLKVKALAPSGCGFGLGVPKDGTVDQNTIAWKLAADSAKLADVKPALAADSPLVARASTTIKLAMTAKSTDGSWNYNGTAAISTVEVDLKDPANLLVTFR